MKKSLPIPVCLLMVSLFFATFPAPSVAFNQFIGFGDSTFDSGYFRYNTTGSATSDASIVSAVANGASGAFVGPGIMNSTMLAGRFGLNGAAVGGGGTNFANGGAFSAPLSVPGTDITLSGVSALTNVATNQQIQNYLASVGGAANPNGLYVVKTGDNDLNFMRAMSASWVAANPTFLQDLALGQAANVAALQAAGARTIVVPNSYNDAVFAAQGGLIASDNMEYYQRSLAYGMMRWGSLSAVGVRFIPADIDSVFRFVVQNPALFGFTPTSVLSANTLSPSISPLLVGWDDVTPAQMQTSLFVGQNGVHFTTAGQTIEADYEASLLTGPSQMSLLAEGAVQGGLARAATIQGQIDLSGLNRGPNGVNVWASGGVSSLAVKNAPGFPEDAGTPFTGSLGADYQTPIGLLLGAAFTLGRQTQDFSMGAGHFDQTDEALSLYAAYKAGPVWGNAVASYALYQDKIERPVALGLFTDSNSADTNGHALSLALRAGGDLRLGPVTTGPVAGLVLQRVRINGFAETGTTGAETGTNGVTALSYGQQTRDSAVTQLGWRLLVDVGPWQPFVEAKWNHELADQDRMVKAAITSTTAASYKVAANPVAMDWSSGSAGVSYKVNERVMVRGTGSAVLYSPQVVTYGGELGLSVAF
uniref:Autotransporter protein or domain, integral membrane beta-barrel involved in protein secretion n=1 Tax=Desulfovibrio sp. U5L TaxID=596152 RepID=I2Q3D2_9BACT